MSSKPSNKKAEYADLRKIWYKKLKDKGFNDIERNEDQLKFYDASRFRRQPPEIFQAKQEYHIMCEHFLNSHKFESRIEKVMWEYYTNGISIRDIVQLLAKVKINLSKNTVWRRIDKLEKIMQRENKLPRDNDE